MIRQALTIGVAMLLTGCFGNSEFGCRGLPPGVQCKSARQVYAMQQGQGVDATTGEAIPQPYEPRDRWPSQPWVNAPTLDAPEPVRQAPRIMRIYVFPYEDSKGDLHMPGYLFSEIESRRWSITDYATNRADGGAGTVYPYDVRSSQKSATTSSTGGSGK